MLLLFVHCVSWPRDQVFQERQQGTVLLTAGMYASALPPHLCTAIDTTVLSTSGWMGTIIYLFYRSLASIESD